MLEELKNITIDENDTIKNSIKKLNLSGKRTLIVVDKKNKLLGTLSDGDIRKSILKVFNLNTKIKNLYQKNPLYLTEKSYTNEEAKKLFISKKITLIPLINSKKTLTSFVSIDNFFDSKEIPHNNFKIPVIIMAGGLGTRLKPFTNVLPKPLLPFENKTIIDRIISNCESYNLTDIFISINTQSKVLRAYLEEMYKNSSIKIRYIEEKKPLGTIGSIKLLSNKRFKTFMVINCDIISFFDYSSFFDFHKKKKNHISFVVSQKQLANPYGVCKKDKKNNFVQIVEKPITNHLINVGIYLINSDIIKYIPRNKEFNATDLINLVKTKNKRIGIFPVSEDCWSDLGQWNQYNSFLKNYDN